MRRSTVASALVGFGLMVLAGVPAAFAQEGMAAGEGRGPQFLLAAAQPSQPPTPVDAASVPVLRRRVSLDLEDVDRAEALSAISRAAGLRLVYGNGVVPRGGRVRLRAEEITVAAALTEVLLDAGVDVLLAPGGSAVLVKRTTPKAPAVGTIAGRVTDAKTGEALPSAEVLLEGTRWRTAAAEDGRYRLADVEGGSYTLAVRRIGYKKRSHAVTVVAEQEVTVDVALEPVATQLDEIVTTVTGEQRRLELGHVVGRINADSLVKEAPVSSLSDLLNGRVPGLQVFQRQGTVGGEVRLQVRGANSVLLPTDPIVIVDGVRYTSTAARSPFAFGPAEVELTSPLNDINPNDIESIEVVKGPSAATLYGTDAANGVVVVTTKRGQAGPARWNAYARASMTEIPSIRFDDHYWGWDAASGNQWSCTLSGVVAGYCTQDSVTVLPNPLNDPDQTIFRSRPRWEAGLNTTGGRQDLRYYFSANFERAIGPLHMPALLEERLKTTRGLDELPAEDLDPNAFDKANLRASLTAALGRNAELRLNTGYIRSATRTPGVGGESVYTNGVSPRPGDPWGTVNTSPDAAFLSHSTEHTDRFVSSVNAQWRPTGWLQARATVGLDLANRNRHSLDPRGEYDGGVLRTGSVLDDRERQLATTVDLGATATVRRDRLSSRTSVGAQYVRGLTDMLSSYGFVLPPGGSSVGEAENIGTAQAYSETVTLGSYVEETVGLNDRLFLTGALRLDGASAFGQDYKAAAYPKVSASWLVSEEPFLPRLPGLDELRLRYAYGASGQQALPAWALPSFSPTRTVLDGTSTTVVDLVGLGNPHLRPERVREHEFGFDAAVLQRRLQLGFTWYRRRTADQIVSLSLPPGLGSIYTNLGLTTQHGFEAELTARVIDTPRLSWDVRLQHSLHRTKLVDLGGGVTTYSANGGYVEGYPLGARFILPMLGFSDANGDGIIVPAEVKLATTPVYAGESTPPRSQTLTSMVGLFQRRLRVSALLERREGFTQIDGIQYIQCVQSCRATVDPTAPIADQAKIAALLSSYTPDQFVQSGDFVRLREVTAALDLPAGVARALRVNSATLSLAARNLALWTDFTGPDPESVTGAISAGAEGIPQGRSWTVRLDLGF